MNSSHFFSSVLKIGSLFLCFALPAVSCTSSENNSAQENEPVEGFPLGLTGTILQHDSIATEFVEIRPVSVWIPPSYHQNEDKTYPVLYFMDGQNLFNPKTSYSRVDWALDEWADSLISTGQMEEVIIVGVWNSPKRYLEYMPEKSVDYFTDEELDRIKENTESSMERPVSDDFLKYLTQDIIPFINQEYRTKSEPEHTLIGGSSMGGLISLYALTEYPEIFGTALCVSTHWPAGNGITLRYFEENLPKPGSHKIYFDYGTKTLDAEYEPFQKQIDSVMVAQGFSKNEDWLTLKFEGHTHSERDWRKRADAFLLFGLGK